MSVTKFTKEHEWLRLDDNNIVTIGITDFAQNALGDLVYVQLPDVGRVLNKGDVAAVVESVKSANDIVMPIAGEVVEINGALKNDPGIINQSPMGDGWLFRVRVNNAAEFNGLLDESAYNAFLKTLA